MASEAQRLIGISLTKIAQSRSHRGGVSLHKNLLVATVLQKARYIFMEEAYNMVHYQQQQPAVVAMQQPQQLPQQQQQPETKEVEELVGLTAEEAGLESTNYPEDSQECTTTPSSVEEFFQTTSCIKCAENNKENQPPSLIILSNTENLTYFDLDQQNNKILADKISSSSSTSSLKRRRAISEWEHETEEAVQSILPTKRSKQENVSTEVEQEDETSPAPSDDSVFLDDATLLSDAITKQIEEDQKEDDNEKSSTQAATSSSSAMEIDRITSLVSIFSFSMSGGGSSDGKQINRSMSTPDLCAAQAKSDTTDNLSQQRTFLAMTV